MGITTDKIKLNISESESWKQFAEIFKFLKIPSPDVQKVLDWTFGDDPMINAANEEISPPAKPPVSSVTKEWITSPVNALQTLLERKLKMKPDDRDRVVMIHEFEYNVEGNEHQLISSMDIIGKDSVHTAMAKTVGLPMALAANLMAEGAFDVKGVLLPVLPEIYEPLLLLLAQHGIQFKERLI
jgi:saccharopine dehydrogenase (NADP+, L-glutamate forming)